MIIPEIVPYDVLEHATGHENPIFCAPRRARREGGNEWLGAEWHFATGLHGGRRTFALGK